MMDNTLTYIHERLAVLYPVQEMRTQIAWWLIEHSTGKSIAWWQAQEQVLLTAEQQQALDVLLARHIDEHMPLQYLIGWVPFGDLTITVEPPILIPRPETEEWVLRLVAQLQHEHIDDLAILDLCTGTGCIALALARALPRAQIDAVDINEHALTLARRNAQQNAIANVSFIHSDLYTQLPPERRYHLIVANPPYIAPAEWDALPASVKQWEDPRALIAADNGLQLIEHIITQAPSRMRFDGRLHAAGIPQLALEIGYQQADSVRALFAHTPFRSVTVQRDSAGHDRVVCAVLERQLLQTDAHVY